jgi:hypothetical protein
MAALALAQETINSASVSGRVTDPQGAVVPGALVTARQMDTNVAAETTTNQDGRFRFPYLKVGPYEVTVHLEGFADVKRALTLTVGSALPFNITSGATTVQGTAARPIVNGAFIDRNAGTGPDFFSLGARLSRTFTFGDRLQLEGLLEGFNLSNRENVVTVNGNFGAGAYPTNPSPTFGQITAIGEPRSLQLGVRVKF